jgi:hypothetical protein
MLELQKNYIPQILSGRHHMNLGAPRDTPWHFVLIGDPFHAYCGAKISARFNRLKRPFWDLPKRMCKDCLATFERLKKELLAEVA